MLWNHNPKRFCQRLLVLKICPRCSFLYKNTLCQIPPPLCYPQFKLRVQCLCVYLPYVLSRYQSVAFCFRPVCANRTQVEKLPLWERGWNLAGPSLRPRPGPRPVSAWGGHPSGIIEGEKTRHVVSTFQLRGTGSGSISQRSGILLSSIKNSKKNINIDS